MITREKAKGKIIACLNKSSEIKNIEFIINEVYDSFEEREIFLSTKDVLCNDCIHYLSDNGNYPLYPCSECSRFYSDSFIRKED